MMKLSKLAELSSVTGINRDFPVVSVCREPATAGHCKDDCSPPDDCDCNCTPDCGGGECGVT